MTTYIIEKALNNNVIIAKYDEEEVVLIGRGIGFGKKKNDKIVEDQVEKMFVLKDPVEQEQYKQLLTTIDDETLKTLITVVEMIREKSDSSLNEHIHVALTDHLVFAIHRLKQGMTIRNPFLIETKTLYPEEFGIAMDVTKLVNKKLAIDLPEDEVGFIALHIHSAMGEKKVGELTAYSDLMIQLVQIIEEQFEITIDKESLDYMRLIRHIRFTIERVVRGEKVAEPKRIKELLELEYPVYYNLAWKLIKVMQQKLQKEVYNAEAVFLTLHLQRIRAIHEQV
ncbi:glucose PTS transporter transcription antiterminator GlcT [Sporosarcina ureilytica]|uniref:Transcriptional antiterminator n=1 Tax=Sporosarcina ureilytica TaxID=298596 RepID=A0A1D8JFZ5_9BACL|nr:transcription antiterminator [Sporosarcina ureilytica]AOV07629.1 transcriptional antiterminator [Sporosarcina ureilytica]